MNIEKTLDDYWLSLTCHVSRRHDATVVVNHFRSYATPYKSCYLHFISGLVKLMSSQCFLLTTVMIFTGLVQSLSAFVYSA